MWRSLSTSTSTSSPLPPSSSSSSFQIPMSRYLSCKMENASERRKLPSKSKKQTNLSCQQSSRYHHHFPENPTQLWGKPLFENQSHIANSTMKFFSLCKFKRWSFYNFIKQIGVLRDTARAPQPPTDPPTGHQISLPCLAQIDQKCQFLLEKSKVLLPT